MINNGILLPLGIQEAREFGKSIFFLVESNPGPGVGILLAYWFFGDKKVRSSAPGALIIHFLGGIHEIYFPYVLMKPILLLAVIAGGVSGIAILQIFNAGLIAAPSVGSILTILVMCPKGSYIGVILSILISTAVSFLIASILIKRTRTKFALANFCALGGRLRHFPCTPKCASHGVFLCYRKVRLSYNIKK